VIHLLHLEPTKCNIVVVLTFTKGVLHVSAHEVPSSGSQL